jgi:PLP dependent protein
MDFAVVRDNLARVRDTIDRVQAAAGLENDVRIVAVTKGHPVDAVRAAHAAGLDDVGENRVQEALAKQEEAQDLAVRWHLIGHLQTNKAKFLPGRFAMVHSIDSWKVAEALAGAMHARFPGAEDEPMPVLLQVNVAGEAQKSGCTVDDAPALARRLAETSGIRLCGLMTMAPFTSDEGTQHRVFASLRTLRDRLQCDGVAAPELSMGMSGDYEAAVAEGATMLRLGTVLFGERQR